MSKARKPKSKPLPTRNSLNKSSTAIQDEHEHLERELRLAKDYWQEKIYHHIKDRQLRSAEFYVASDAYSRLRRIQERAESWNRTEHGMRCPVSTELLADSKNEFCEPKGLCRDESLTPDVLAAIGASLMQKRREDLTAIAAIGVAHDLLLAAGRYIESLPEQKHGADMELESLDQAMRFITFSEIEASNRKSSGQLPLLPPTGQKQKGADEQTLAENPLSLTAIKTAIMRYLEKKTINLTQKEYEHEQAQDEKFATSGKLFRCEKQTYQEWVRVNKEIVDDALKHNRISLQELCNLRWDRFVGISETRRQSAQKRKSKQGNIQKMKSQKKLPSSAASSSETAGIPDK